MYCKCYQARYDIYIMVTFFHSIPVLDGEFGVLGLSKFGFEIEAILRGRRFEYVFTIVDFIGLPFNFKLRSQSSIIFALFFAYSYPQAFWTPALFCKLFLARRISFLVRQSDANTEIAKLY